MIDAAIILLKEHLSALNDPPAQPSLEHLLLDIVLVNCLGDPVGCHLRR
ncbi:MAG: hypothetical protein HC781_14495 [Leptolyngbyaceae cyanobacterium CSU_1_4]|nr:hypothetical protein [Leptolyngbyaceae cyanobacterium CSU_1_4]